jgi:AcrR family transcriptional regulator
LLFAGFGLLVLTSQYCIGLKMDDQAPSRKRQPPEVRQAQILDAAYRVFAEAGFSDARMEDIARDASVSKGTIYLYYPTKTALFEALLLRDLKPRIAMLAQILDGYDGPLEVILGKGIGLLAMMVEGGTLPIYPKLLIAEAGRFPELARIHRTEVMEVMLGALSRLFERAMTRGEIIREDPLTLAHLFMAPIIKTMIWYFTFGPTDDAPFPHAAHLNTHLRHFLRGLEPKDLQRGSQ